MITSELRNVLKEKFSKCLKESKNLSEFESLIKENFPDKIITVFSYKEPHTTIVLVVRNLSNNNETISITI